MESKSNLLDGKIAIVTGAGRGIGRAIADRFLSEGAVVYGVDLQEGSMDGLVNHPNFTPSYFDISDQNAIRDLFVKIQKTHGKLDVMVNNAGIMQDAYLPMVTDQLLQKTFEVNVFAMVYMMKYAAKLMRKQKAGCIINAASIMGISGNKGQIAYAASKGAVIALTKSAAKELAEDNIRVNAVAPGVVGTELLKNVPEDQMAVIKSKIGLNRLATPEDVADVYLFLASDLSRYVSGQVVGVDGMMIN